MSFATIRQSRAEEGEQVFTLWRRSVDATHHFLSADDRMAIEEEVRDFLPSTPVIVAVDDKDQPVGFMLMNGSHMEALFIDPDHRGKSVGRALVGAALASNQSIATDVNEQNEQAVGFYKRMGFVPTGRSAEDGQGRPYPLIHLRHGSRDSEPDQRYGQE